MSKVCKPIVAGLVPLEPFSLGGMMPAIERIAKTVAASALPLWAVGMTTVVACLMVSHWVPLPCPETGTTLASEMFRDPSHPERWTAIHFLYVDCPCSQRILNHVIERDAMADVTEHIVLIGQSEEKAELARQHGYQVHFVSPQELKKTYGVESAPLLVVIDPQGTIGYSGGYTSRKQGLDYQEVKLIRSTVNGEPTVQLPLYGCAVSKELKDLVDPLGLKY